MARKQKGGNVPSYDGAMLFVYGVVLIVILIFVFVALSTGKSNFVSGPSASGDKQEVTPAGNVILY